MLPLETQGCGQRDSERHLGPAGKELGGGNGQEQVGLLSGHLCIFPGNTEPWEVA